MHSLLLKNFSKKSTLHYIQTQINMKVVAIAFAFLLAGVSAWPQKHTSDIESAIRAADSRLTVSSIINAIEEVSQSIRDAGLDPLNIENEELDYALPVPTIFNAKAALNNFNFWGLSNIVVNRMNYAVLTSRLTFNVELPQIAFNLGIAAYDVNLFDTNLNGIFSGALSINNLVVTGDVRVSLGIITGISIRSMEVTFSLGSVNSQLNVVVQGLDISRGVNAVLGESIPGTLKAYENDINELITIIARDIVEQNL